MAQKQTKHALLPRPRLRNLHANRHRHRTRSETVIRTWLADDTYRQRRLRLHLGRHPHLHRSGGTDGARVHVQRLHAERPAERSLWRFCHNGSGRWSDGPAGQMGLNPLRVLSDVPFLIERS